MKRICILLLAAALLLACTAKNPTAAAPTEAPVVNTEASAVNTDAPAKTDESPAKQTVDPDSITFRFSAEDLDGNTVTQSIFAAYDLIMVNCWAYWCGPCLNEMPDLEQLYQNYPNLLILGVSVDNSEPVMTRRAAESAGVTYPIIEPKGDLETFAMQCQYIPATFFLKPDGTILTEEPYVGSRSYADWESIIKEYLP